MQSRWLWRLETLARGAGVNPARSRRPTWRLGAARWMRPAASAPVAAPAPRPRPSSAARASCRSPGIERWVRDPYAVYAQHILSLMPLDRPDEPVEALARGTAIHAALRGAAPSLDRRPARRLRRRVLQAST